MIVALPLTKQRWAAAGARARGRSTIEEEERG